MSSLAELDRSNVVDVDLGSAEFKANAHRHMAEWARRPPFYVLGSGPPQVVVGRYADVHRVFSDTENFASEMPRGPGWEQFNKIMDAQFVTQMDGEQHARVRRLLMPAFSSRRIEQLKESITTMVDGMLDEIEKNGPEFDAMQDLGAHLVVDALLTAMVAMDERRKAIFVAFHDLIPGTTYVKPGESWAPELRQAFDRTMEEIKVIIEERRASPRSGFHQRSRQRPRRRRQAQRARAVRSDFRHLRRLAVGNEPRRRRRALSALHPRRSAPAVDRRSVAHPRGDRGVPPARQQRLFHLPPHLHQGYRGRRHQILKGMVVRPSPLAPNYDPDQFPDPLRFDIHRKPKRILSFGAGPHHCVGNILGRTTITTAIRRLLERFPKAHMIDPNFTPVYGGAVGELRLQSLPMRIH